MQVLTLTLPVLKATDGPLEFQGVQPTDAASWFTPATLIPIGLNFAQRVELMAHMRCEDARTQQFQQHADPNQWAEETGSDAEDDDANSGADEAGGSRQHTSSRKKKFVKLTEEDLLVDWYDVLKLQQQDAASEDQIKAAYRRRCLETHPDKQADHSDELFKKVQRAFDILGDSEARLSYDSSRPFDDSIPGESVEEADFYTIFGNVFERNKKWSSERGLPSLGHDKTSYKEVVRFYDRWSVYKSWRDFSHLADLEEIDEGMCREEKRYYMRENERQLSYFRKEEMKRIKTLVERARKADPRLRRRREQEEAKRQKEVDERETFKRQMREKDERRRAEEEARERQKKEEELRKVQESKNTIRQAQQDMLSFLAEHKLLDSTPANKLLANAVRKPNVVWLFSKINTSEDALATLGAVNSASTTQEPRQERGNMDGEDTFDGESECAAVLAFNALVLNREKQVGVTRYGEAIKKVATEKQKVEPPTIATATANTSYCPEWTDEDLNRLQKATAKYPPGTVERWSKICVQLRDKFTEEQALAKVNELTATLQAGTAHAPVSSAAAVVAAVAEEWTVKQQKQLEQGLRELKDYKEKDKFQKIAKLVDNKTAKECFDRYKFLCTVNKKK